MQKIRLIKFPRKYLLFEVIRNPFDVNLKHFNGIEINFSVIGLRLATENPTVMSMTQPLD